MTSSAHTQRHLPGRIRARPFCAAATALLLALPAAGCSTVRPRSGEPEVLRDWATEHQGSAVVVVPRDARRGFVIGTLAGLTIDPQHAAPPRIDLRVNRQAASYSIDGLRRARGARHLRGVLDGALIGLGIGGLAGATFGLASKNDFDSCTLSCKTSERVTIATLGFGGFGAALGAIFGGILGHGDVLRF